MIVRNIKIPKIEVIAAWSTAQNLFVMSSNNVVYKLFQDEFKQSDQRVNQTVVETEDCSYMNMIVSGSLQTQQKHLFIKNMKHYVLCNNHLYKLAHFFLYKYRSYWGAQNLSQPIQIGAICASAQELFVVSANVVSVIDPHTATIQQLSFDCPYSSYQSAVYFSGKIILFGGITENSKNRSFTVLNLINNQTETFNNFQISVSNNAHMVLFGAKIYLFAANSCFEIYFLEPLEF
ncbi:Kelch-type_beta propeller [Hexamita inflata]|uniref:Kelch-type beta propeller n=1 Tax=Hexamita inflata TaxID=28002 RepID=A0AA86RSU3_9EUKA|nr:Kelch-type beta propeller [Hexamita inflata]